MPLKKKNNGGGKMATISQDTRTDAEKAKAKSLFEAKKRQAEEDGADFNTPEFIKQQTAKKKERLLRSLAVGVGGAMMSMMPIASVATPYIPAAQALAAEFASRIIPKQKRKGELYETITKPRLVKKVK